MPKSEGCEHCKYSRGVPDEYDEGVARVVKLIPLPGINLTTGETIPAKEDPDWALFIYDDPDEEEDYSFPIAFCPWCGRNLYDEGGEQNAET